MAQLDIVIPVYNEGRNILRVLDALKTSVKTPFRVLICYDRDEDDTLAALADYAHPGFDVVLVKNKGTGVLGAVMTGFAASQTEAVLVFPADDTYNAGIIDGMVEKWREGADIVVASRFMKGGVMKGCPWLKATLVRSAAFTLYHAARLPVHDPSNGFRLFSKRLLERIPVESPKGWAFSIELLVKCHRLGWPIREVPAAWYERTQGKSRFRMMRWLPVYLKWYFYAFATTYLGIKKV